MQSEASAWSAINGTKSGRIFVLSGAAQGRQEPVPGRLALYPGENSGPVLEPQITQIVPIDGGAPGATPVPQHASAIKFLRYAGNHRGGMQSEEQRLRKSV